MVILLNQLVFPIPLGTTSQNALGGVVKYDITASSLQQRAPLKTNSGISSGLDRLYLLPLETISLPLIKKDTKIMEVDAKAAMAIDLVSGKVLYEKNVENKLSIASITKLATALVVVDEVKSLDETTVISASALKAIGDSGKLVVGERIRVRDLLYMMLIASSNDAATALAEYVGGTKIAPENLAGKTEEAKFKLKIDTFGDLMNNKVKALDLPNSHFSNPAGIDEEGNYSSAADVTKLVRYIFNGASDAESAYRKELIRDIIKTKQITVYSEDKKNAHTIKSTNKLLGVVPNVLGGKTGFTDEAGESLVLITSGPQGRHPIITVVLNASDRFEQTRQLADWVFGSYHWRD